jgi:tRNA(Ile)-lysidine synthetase-like protein
MIHLLGNLPHEVIVACSGGPDSMAALSFLMRTRKVHVAYYHHGTEHGEEALCFLRDYCTEHSIEFSWDKLLVPVPKGDSKEAFWRENRYSFLELVSAHANCPVVLAHHLDDCVENWIWTSLHGVPHTIPYRRGSCIRPFLLSRKDAMVSWCERHRVPFLVDPSNSDPSFCRNRIRTTVVPALLEINPGLHKVVARRVLEENQSSLPVLK